METVKEATQGARRSGWSDIAVSTRKVNITPDPRFIKEPVHKLKAVRALPQYNNNENTDKTVSEDNLLKGSNVPFKKLKLGH